MCLRTRRSVGVLVKFTICSSRLSSRSRGNRFQTNQSVSFGDPALFSHCSLIRFQPRRCPVVRFAIRARPAPSPNPVPPPEAPCLTPERFFPAAASSSDMLTTFIFGQTQASYVPDELPFNRKDCARKRPQVIGDVRQLICHISVDTDTQIECIRQVRQPGRSQHGEESQTGRRAPIGHLNAFSRVPFGATPLDQSRGVRSGYETCGSLDWSSGAATRTEEKVIAAPLRSTGLVGNRRLRRNGPSGPD